MVVASKVVFQCNYTGVCSIEQMTVINPNEVVGGVLQKTANVVFVFEVNQTALAFITKRNGFFVAHFSVIEMEIASREGLIWLERPSILRAPTHS